MTISDSSPTPQSPNTTLPEHLFPTLTPQQISRIAAIGRRRSTTRGEVLVDVGDRVVPFFVILLRVKEFLARNGHPFHYVDLDRDRAAQELFDRFR